MLFLKPLIKTTLIASVLFFALVYLGMKYHWIGYLDGNNDKAIELAIPANAAALKNDPTKSNTFKSNDAVNSDLSSDQNASENPEDFTPEIIQTVRSSSNAAVNMSKEQIKTGCTNLLKRTITDAGLLELAIGDCVISNFRDSIREIKSNEESVRSTKNRQAQIQKNNIRNACIQRLNRKNYTNEVEKQLLLGICMSRELK
jgi:hypothetical protein